MQPSDTLLSNYRSPARMLKRLEPSILYAEPGSTAAEECEAHRLRDRAMPRMFTIPREGSMNGADVVVIPNDAPHPANASLFLNYLLRPDIAARITNVVGFANGVISSAPLVPGESPRL
jgi:ABC-type uncharacterized transport system YnjBCD substrate-binding protein